MALFAQSTLPSASAIYQIADAAGASADTQMTARAGVSLKAAYQHFNNFANWEFALVEAPTILVTAPFTFIMTVSATGGGSSLTFASTAHGVLPDDWVSGPMFSVPVRATTTATTSISFGETINPSLWTTAGASASSTTLSATRDFYDIPSDWKQPYSVRLLGSQHTLQPIGRRFYDRSSTSEFVVSTPMYYDIFGIGSRSKIRLLRPPAYTDRLQLRYYRRMNYASAITDFPEQYEPYLIAYAKWFFLTDKADSVERANTWKSFATEGIAQMLKDNAGTPDDNLQFIPGHYSYSSFMGPNSTTQIPWDT